MKLSAEGLNLIKAFESCLKATAGGFRGYYCPANKLTIGWGHTNDHGRQFNAGSVWTQAECDAELASDMAHFEAVVDRLVKVPLEQFQYDALASFSYNCGEGALAGSTLLKKVNAGNFVGAAAEFLKWNRGGGKVLAGLVRRRASESLLFQGITDANYDGKPDAAQPPRQPEQPRVDAPDDSAPSAPAPMPQQVDPPQTFPDPNPTHKSKSFWATIGLFFTAVSDKLLSFGKFLLTPEGATIGVAVLGASCFLLWLGLKSRAELVSVIKDIKNA